MNAIITRKVGLFIGFIYLACAVSVALHPRSLWDIGTFLALIVAANFLIVVGFGPIFSGESRSNGKRTN